MAQVKKISKKNVLLLASASFFVLGVIFFSLAIQKYQVLTSSRATSGNQCTQCDGPCTLDGQFCEEPTGKCVEGKKELKIYKCENDIWTFKYNQAGGSCPGNNECGGETPTPGEGTPTGVQPTGGGGTKDAFCNDNIGGDLNTSGSTSFSITCTGKLDQAYDYVLFWCPEKTTGASYCGDPGNIGSGSSQVLERDSGNSIPGTMNKSTNKTCGCVQWDVGIHNNSIVAGGAIICSDNPCETTPTPTTSGGGGDTPTPTTPANNTPTPTTPSGTTNTPTLTQTSTPAPSDTPIPTRTPTNSPTSTPTKTPTPQPTDTPIPTDTPVPTETPIPTDTPVPTETPIPTNTSVPPTPTPTPVQKLAVNEQPPGGVPWTLILVPIGLLFLGLLL